MDYNIPNSKSYQEARLKSLEDLVHSLKDQLEEEHRRYRRKEDELKKKYNGLVIERDNLARERDELAQERDDLEDERRRLKLENMELIAENRTLKAERDAACQNLDLQMRLADFPDKNARSASQGARPETAAAGSCHGGGAKWKVPLSEEEMEQLVQRLLPEFESEEMVRRYINSIFNLDDANITRLTNHYWDMGAIQGQAKKRYIWRALSDAKLYRANESNWNAMVNFKRKRK